MAVALEAALLPPSGALLLLGCRCGPLLLAVPGLGWAGRGAALLLGTLLAAPLLAPALPASAGLGPRLVPLALHELLIGGVLTLAAALPWAVVYSVGALLDGGRGHDAAPRRVAAPVFGALALALFFGLGGARIVVTALAASYELLPVLPLAAAPVGTSLAPAGQSLAGLSGQLLAVALRLALPLLGAQLLAELLLALGGGLLSPRQPQRRRAPVASSLLGLAVLLLGAHALLPQLRQLMLWLPALLRQALDALAPT
jgi:type III secretory pathway component EscT